MIELRNGPVRDDVGHYVHTVAPEIRRSLRRSKAARDRRRRVILFVWAFIRWSLLIAFIVGSQYLVGQNLLSRGY